MLIFTRFYVFKEILCWRSFYKSLRDCPNRCQRVSKKRARNQPNSRLQFLSASFDVPGWPCTSLWVLKLDFGGGRSFWMSLRESVWRFAPQNFPKYSSFRVSERAVSGPCFRRAGRLRDARFERGDRIYSRFWAGRLVSDLDHTVHMLMPRRDNRLSCVEDTGILNAFHDCQLASIQTMPSKGWNHQLTKRGICAWKGTRAPFERYSNE